MRRFAAVVGLGLALLGLPGAPALAANPEVNHFVDSGSDVDPDFCGTGQEIQISFTIRVNEQLSPNRLEYQSSFQGRILFTNPDTGDTVLNRVAGRFTVLTVGDEEGVHTHEFTNVGLPEQLRVQGGGLLTLDAGIITFREVFDGEQFISGEISVVHGPHPDAESDFALFCEIMTPALGIA